MQENFIEQIQQKFRIERTVQIDNEMVVLRIEGVSNTEKGGTWKTVRPRTTLTFSSNPDQNAAVASQLNAMEQEMMQHLEGIRQNLANGDADADDLFSGLQGYDKDESDDTEREKEVLMLPMRQSKKAVVKIVNSELDKLNTDL